jgi:predicted nucleic acid-binding Zn ribbon protein
MTVTPAEAARILGALRPRETCICVVCGASFEALARPTQPAQTCSPRCRQQLLRNRRKAQRENRS